MNLQESIRRILREEKNVPSYVKRRLFIVDKYIDELDPEFVYRYWTEEEARDYVNQTMSDMVRSIVDFSINISDDDYSEKYNETYGALIHLGYQEKLFNFFYKSLQNYRIRFMKP